MFVLWLVLVLSNTLEPSLGTWEQHSLRILANLGAELQAGAILARAQEHWQSNDLLLPVLRIFCFIAVCRQLMQWYFDFIIGV